MTLLHRVSTSILLPNAISYASPLAMPYQLTAAQLELQAARKAAKLAKAEASKLAPAAAKQQTLSPEEIEKRRFLRRDWISTGSSSAAGSRRAKIITWNVGRRKCKAAFLFADSSSSRRRSCVSDASFVDQRSLIHQGESCFRARTACDGATGSL